MKTHSDDCQSVPLTVTKVVCCDSANADVMLADAPQIDLPPNDLQPLAEETISLLNLTDWQLLVSCVPFGSFFSSLFSLLLPRHWTCHWKRESFLHTHTCFLDFLLIDSSPEPESGSEAAECVHSAESAHDGTSGASVRASMALLGSAATFLLSLSLSSLQPTFSTLYLLSRQSFLVK